MTFKLKLNEVRERAMWPISGRAEREWKGPAGRVPGVFGELGTWSQEKDGESTRR